MPINSSRDIFEPLPMCDGCLVNELPDDQLKVSAQDEIVELQIGEINMLDTFRRLRTNEAWTKHDRRAIWSCYQKCGARLVELSD